MSERPTTKHDIQRDELNITRPNFAEVTRVFVTGTIGMTFSGVDTGTGDITLFVTGTDVSDAAYNSVLWDGVTDIAPSKNAVRDKFVSIDAAIAGIPLGMVGQNKGITLGTGTTLNINGTRLVGSISGTVLNLTNSPDPVDNIGIFGQNAGVPLGTGTIFNTSTDLTLSLSGTVFNLSIPVQYARPFLIMGG